MIGLLLTLILVLVIIYGIFELGKLGYDFMKVSAGDPDTIQKYREMD